MQSQVEHAPWRAEHIVVLLARPDSGSEHGFVPGHGVHVRLAVLVDGRLVQRVRPQLGRLPVRHGAQKSGAAGEGAAMPRPQAGKGALLHDAAAAR